MQCLNVLHLTRQQWINDGEENKEEINSLIDSLSWLLVEEGHIKYLIAIKSRLSDFHNWKI